MIALLGLPAVPTADAAPAAADATRAANYLVRNLPKTADGVGASATVALGLATANDCTYAPALRTLVSQMEKGAKGYLYPGKKLNPARAANLAIAVEALGLNPRKFAGYNLVSLVTKGLPADGRIGSSDSAFSQSLGIIALDRADATIPVTLLTKLLSLQDDTGAFGYDFNGFQADPDTTGMGILALHAIGQLDPQVDAAKDWADDNQVEDGYWDSYSPVDSTGLLGSALAAEGEDVSAAKTWLGSVQNSDGGFPNSLDEGTASDLMATVDALYLISGKSLLDASINLGKCPASPKKLPAATTSCTGVWVVVDRGNGQETVRCATTYSTGIAALKSAGLKVGLDTNGMVARVNGFPSIIDTTWAKYWTYWSATQNADGTWTDWKFSSEGAGTAKPEKGAAQGWWYAPYPGDGDQTTDGFLTPPDGYAASPVPTIENQTTPASITPKVGETLGAVTGTWDPVPAFSYRWYRNGSSISGATKATYKLSSYDVGRVITVKVTAKLSGHQTVSRTSLPTAKVTK
ncbi:MAG: hypothetical protein U0R79_02890 [Propionicimonas sp.]